MNRKALLLVLLIAALPSPCRAQSWGWPPASYTAGGIRHCDCAQFRGICDFLRDRGWGMRRWHGSNSGYCAYPSSVSHPSPSTARPGCGCGGNMAQHLPLSENQEPPLLADSTSAPSGPVLLAPEEMESVELETPVEGAPFGVPNLDRRSN